MWASVEAAEAKARMRGSVRALVPSLTSSLLRRCGAASSSRGYEMIMDSIPFKAKNLTTIKPSNTKMELERLLSESSRDKLLENKNYLYNYHKKNTGRLKVINFIINLINTGRKKNQSLTERVKKVNIISLVSVV